MQWSTNCKVFKDSGLEVWVQFELRPCIATLVRYFYSMISSQMFYGLVFKSQRNLQSPFATVSAPRWHFLESPIFTGKTFFIALLIFDFSHQLYKYIPLYRFTESHLYRWLIYVCGSEHVNKPLDFEVPCFQTNLTAVTSKVNFNHGLLKLLFQPCS
jgi:hypothetical protein